MMDQMEATVIGLFLEIDQFEFLARRSRLTHEKKLQYQLLFAHISQPLNCVFRDLGAKYIRDMLTSSGTFSRRQSSQEFGACRLVRKEFSSMHLIVFRLIVLFWKRPSTLARFPVRQKSVAVVTSTDWTVICVTAFVVTAAIVLRTRFDWLYLYSYSQQKTRHDGVNKISRMDFVNI